MEPHVQGEIHSQYNVPIPYYQHSGFGIQSNYRGPQSSFIPSQYIPSSGSIGYGSEEENLKKDFDLFDTNRLGVLDAESLSNILSLYGQHFDSFMVTRLIRNFSRGSNVILFPQFLTMFYFLKRLRNAFIQNNNSIPPYQAPNILQGILPPEKHSSISGAIQRWLSNYYLQLQAHQGLSGLTQQQFGKFRNLSHPQNPQGGLLFDDILEMALDTMERPSA